MSQTVTVTGRLTTEPPSLHATSEPHTPAVGPGIHILALDEPVSTDDGADLEQATRIPDPKLVQMALESHLVGGEVAPLGPRHVARLLCAGADLHGPVPVLGARLVRDDLHAVELEDGAGDAAGRGRVVEGGHALFRGEGAGAWGEGVGFAFEGGRGGRGEDGEGGGGVEAAGADVDDACSCFGEGLDLSLIHI